MCHVPGDVNPQQHRRETSYIDLVLSIIAKGILTLLISFVSNVSAQHPSHLLFSESVVTQIKANGNGGYFSIRRIGERQARVGLVREVFVGDP